MPVEYICALDAPAGGQIHALEVGRDATLCDKRKDDDLRLLPEPFPGTDETRKVCDVCRDLVRL